MQSIICARFLLSLGCLFVFIRAAERTLHKANILMFALWTSMEIVACEINANIYTNYYVIWWHTHTPTHALLLLSLLSRLNNNNKKACFGFGAIFHSISQATLIYNNFPFGHKSLLFMPELNDILVFVTRAITKYR